MPHAIVLRAPGGPECLEWQEIPLPTPQAGEVRLRQHAAGLNFIDIYHRTGLYALPYPAILGMEAAGVVDAVGEGVDQFSPGDRVAYVGHGPGAYATHRVIDATQLVPLPDPVSMETAAGIMLKGLTAQYLLTRSFAVQDGDVVVIHAAAGGVGLLLCQWAKYMGATVIGTVGSEEKAALAVAHGCDFPIVYTHEKVSTRVRAITHGRGADVVYDSVGKDTFMDSLDCLKPLGMMVSFGQASGKIPPFDIGLLASKGSLFLTRPSLTHYISDTATYQAAARHLLSLVASGVLHAHIDRVLPLQEAAQAHQLLESRQTSGAVVLGMDTVPVNRIP